MAKGLIRIKGGNFMEVVSDIPDFEIYIWDEDLAQIEPRYEQYKRERSDLFNNLKSCKYKYLIAVKEEYVRDSQVACDDYVHKASSEEIDYSLPWYDLKGEMVLGTYEGNSEEEAIDKASETVDIHRSALVAYPLA